MTTNQTNSNKNGLNIDEIVGDVMRSELREVVKKEFGCENIEFCIEPGSETGESFLAEIYRVLLKNSGDNDDFKSRSLILKIISRDPVRRKFAESRNTFLYEIFMYEKVLGFFNDFQLSKGISGGEAFNEFANCYSSISDEFSECLFLEDLKLGHFEMVKLRQESLSFDHISLLMKALGKFHAVSFAVKDQQLDKFNELKNQMPEQYWRRLENEFLRMYEGLYNKLMYCFEEEQRFDLMEKFKRVVREDHKATLMSLVSGASAEPYAVICHGDLTTNNSMFRKDDQGKPIEIRLFDWQYSRYASPVTDLVLYLLCSTTKELRDKHYDDFLKIYHESLSSFLSRLGSDAQKLFPFEALLEQLQKFGAYAGCVGTLLIPFIFSDIFASYKTEPLDKTVSNESEKAYNKRLVDMFDDMARFGYI